MKRKRPQQSRAKAKISDLAFAAVVLAIHIAITLTVALYHEPWRDEADPWLIMRDGGVKVMLERTGYMGTPSLWYLIIAPLPKLGLPYFSMTLVHLVIGWAGVFVFLRYAPFPRWLRFLFAFTYYAAYEYSIVARPYALLMLLLFAVMHSWPRRHENPIVTAIFVALLANVTTHGLFMALLFGVIFLYETIKLRRLADPRALGAMAIMMAAGLITTWELWPPADAPKGHIWRAVDPESAAWAFGNAFLPGAGLWLPFALAVVALAVIAYAIGRRWAVQFFLWGSLISLTLIYALVWVSGYRHSGLMLLTVIAALWMATAYDIDPVWLKRATAVLALSFLYCIVLAVRYWNLEITRPFSGAREMAAFIAANHLDHYEIAAHPPPQLEPILPYLPGKHFYYPGLLMDASYMPWDSYYNSAIRMPYGVAAGEARNRFGRTWLLLVNTQMKNPEQYGFRLIYTNLAVPFEKDDERYWLYAPLDWGGAPLPELR
ncbi:MAG TPA: hypothetical protein VMU84_03575 [Thermoanaerobaculia bacterium]|nr:hypothetical protein [Thermoanaerobaculia bacterium]